MTFGRFLLEAMSIRNLQCPECKTGLSLAFRYGFLPMLVIAAIFILGARPLLKSLLPTTREIPFGIAVAMILVLFILLKGMTYLFAEWRIKNVESK